MANYEEFQKQMKSKIDSLVIVKPYDIEKVKKFRNELGEPPSLKLCIYSLQKCEYDFKKAKKYMSDNFTFTWA